MASRIQWPHYRSFNRPPQLIDEPRVDVRPSEAQDRISHLKDDKIPRPEVRTELRDLLRDRDFDSVRRPEAMTEFGDEEFGAWSRFWMRVSEAFEESLR